MNELLVSDEEPMQGELDSHPEVKQLFINALYKGDDPNKVMLAIEAAHALFDMLDD